MVNQVDVCCFRHDGLSHPLKPMEMRVKDVEGYGEHESTTGIKRAFGGYDCPLLLRLKTQLSAQIQNFSATQ